MVVTLTATLAVPIAVANSPSPNYCSIYSSNSSTSSDGSMFVKAIAYQCSSGGTSGQVEWNAYFGGSHFTNSYKACGNTYSAPTSDNIVAVSFYYGTSCSPAAEGNYNFNTTLSGSAGTVSGSSTTDVVGWSGNCAWGGSACTATASASAP